MTKWTLFIDDERLPNTKYPVLKSLIGRILLHSGINSNLNIICRNFAEAEVLVNVHGIPSIIHFDHDLGNGKTGYDFARFIIDSNMDGKPFPPDFKFYVHSQNPIGKHNIESLFVSYFNQ